MIRCFFLEPTGRVLVSLRRYAHGDCPGNGQYHDASVALYEEPVELDAQGYHSNGLKQEEPHSDPRWPTCCSSCGYLFREDDAWQRFTQDRYRRADTGEEMTLRSGGGDGAPAGAMWYAPWLSQFCEGQDGHILVVRTPGGDWIVDSQASNCPLKADHRQQHHHCWPRQGVPPDVTVAKEFGSTCGAGGGSIQCGSYHGFLKHGYLTDEKNASGLKNTTG